MFTWTRERAVFAKSLHIVALQHCQCSQMLQRQSWSLHFTSFYYMTQAMLFVTTCTRKRDDNYFTSLSTQITPGQDDGTKQIAQAVPAEKLLQANLTVFSTMSGTK
jgi:hypothetical protein